MPARSQGSTLEKTSQSSKLECGLAGLCAEIRSGSLDHHQDRREERKRMAEEVMINHEKSQKPVMVQGRSILPLCADGQFWDDVKGGSLDPELNRKARQEELDFVKKRRVHEVVPWSQAIEKTGKPNIRTRWVDTTKGRAEQTALELHTVTVTHLANVKEWVVLEEVCVEDLIAVLLIDVAATTNARGAVDDTDLLVRGTSLALEYVV
jgi:hypothetical protein